MISFDGDLAYLFRAEEIVNHEIAIAHEQFPLGVSDPSINRGAHSASIPIKVD
jgi:hypothetical protein